MTMKYYDKDAGGKEVISEINLVYVFIGIVFVLGLLIPSTEQRTYSYGYGWAGGNYVSDYTECEEEFGFEGAVIGCKAYIEENM